MDRQERDPEREPLHEPAGVEVPPDQELITPRTTRRQEQLDRLKAEHGERGYQPPGQGDPSSANKASEQEQLELRERFGPGPIEHSVPEPPPASPPGRESA